MAITTINENDYIKDSREVINDNFTELDTLKAPLASPAFTGNPTAPTPTAGDNSTKLATTEFVNTKAEKYLPLSGGTMTGSITAATRTVVKRDVDNDAASFFGGSGEDKGASLILIGKDWGNVNRSSFVLTAHDGTNSKILQGYADGTLTWGGSNVLTKRYKAVTKQYVTNSVVTEAQFNRCAAWVSNGFLYVSINMNFNNGVTTSDITTVGKLKNVNIITDIIEVAVEQNATFKCSLLGLYNNGSDVDLRVYSVGATGGGRYGHLFTVPLR